MKSAVLKDRKVQIIDINPPDLKNKKGAIIKVHGCGLCGSDIVKINNSTKENEDKIVLGHEIVGEIVDINVDIIGNCAKEPFKKGDIIAMGHHYPCNSCKYCKNGNYSMCAGFKATNIFPGGFSEYIHASEGHLKNTVFKKPEHLTEEEFSFLEPLSCCIRAVKRAGLNLDCDNREVNALVIGLGSIGTIMAQAIKAFGARVYGFDINPERQNFVKKYGIEFDKNIKYDIIFMASGSAKAIDTALQLIDFGGKIVVFSSIKNDDGYKNNEIYYKELTILGSYSPAPVDIRLSYEMLSNRMVDVKGFSTQYKLEELNCAIDDTKTGKIMKGYIKL